MDPKRNDYDQQRCIFVINQESIMKLDPREQIAQRPTLPTPLSQLMRVAGLQSGAVSPATVTRFPQDHKAERLLLRSEVLELTRMSRGTLATMVRDGTFCQPIKFGPRMTRFVEAEVRAWIHEHIVQRVRGSGTCQADPGDAAQAEASASTS
jgi:predicted DNA-binding transcriptional regulator AlpA